MNVQELADLVEKIEGEMCCMENPVFKVICLRKIGHPGQHWFMARWVDSRQAIESAIETLNYLGKGAAG